MPTTATRSPNPIVPQRMDRFSLAPPADNPHVCFHVPRGGELCQKRPRRSRRKRLLAAGTFRPAPDERTLFGWRQVLNLLASRRQLSLPICVCHRRGFIANVIARRRRFAAYG